MKTAKTVMLLFVLFLLIVQFLGAQDVTFTNLGKEFFMCYPANEPREPADPSDPYWHYFGMLILTSTEATQGSVMTADGKYNEFSIPAYGTDTVTINTTLWLLESDKIYRHGISIHADHDIAAYFLSLVAPGASNDMALLFPTQSLGYEHIVMCSRDNIPTAGWSPPPYGRGPSMFAIVAPFDNTHITITPTATTEGGNLAGVPFEITLDSYEAYQVLASTASLSNIVDLTGSQVIADKPVGVFGGSQIGFMPDTIFAADYMLEMMPPISTWGKNFNCFPIEKRNDWQKDVLKILASEDATTVNIYDVTDGTTTITLDRGEYFEWNGMPCDPGNYAPNSAPWWGSGCSSKMLDSPTRIESDKPVLVGQYLTGGVLTYGTPNPFSGQKKYNALGDPAFLLAPPQEQYNDVYVFLTPSGYNNDYLNVAIDKNYTSTVEIDGGAPVFSTDWFDIPNSSFQGARIEVEPGNHVIRADTTMLLQIYAFDNYWASYAAVGGQRITMRAAYEITKYCELTPAISGYYTTWRIVLKQTIGVPSHDVMIVDTLPPGFSLRDTLFTVEVFGNARRDSIVSPSPGDEILTWGYFSMTDSDSVVITFDAAITIGTEGTFDNGVWNSNEFGFQASNESGLRDSLDDVEVVMPPMPIADAGPDTVIYYGTTATIGGDPTASSGTAPLEIEWTSEPTGFTSSDSNPTVSPTELTQYIVTVTDSFGFVDYDTCFVDIIMEARHLEFGIGNGAPCSLVYIPLYIDSITRCRLDGAWMRFAIDPDVAVAKDIVVAGTITESWTVSNVEVNEALGTIEAEFSGTALSQHEGGIFLILEAEINCDAVGGDYAPVDIDSFAFTGGQPEVTWTPGLCYVQLSPENFSCDIRLNRTVGPKTEDNIFTIGASNYATVMYDPGIDNILVPQPATFVQGYIPIDDPDFTHISELRKDMRPVSPPQTWYLITEGEPNGIARWTSLRLPEGEFRINRLTDMKRDTTLEFGENDTLVIEWLLPGIEEREYWLYAGWNMVSSPVLPTTKPAIEVFGGTPYGVFRYKRPGTAYGYTNLVKSGEGYWVWADRDTQFYIVGSVIDGYRWPIYKGWNLIGAPATDVSVADIEITPDGGIMGSIYYWQAELGGGYTTVSSLEPARGYWLLSNKNGVLHVPDTYRRRPAREEPTPVWESKLNLDFETNSEELTIGYAPNVESGLGYGDVAFPPPPPNSDEYRLCALVADDIELTKDLSPENEWELEIREPAVVNMEIPEGFEIFIDGIKLFEGTPVSLDAGKHSITATEIKPERFAILGCVPNPFNASTDIVVTLPEGGKLTLEIFDVAGHRVWIKKDECSAGVVRLPWNGKDISGVEMPSGIYLARVSYDGKSAVVRAMLIK